MADQEIVCNVYFNFVQVGKGRRYKMFAKCLTCRAMIEYDGFYGDIKADAKAHAEWHANTKTWDVNSTHGRSAGGMLRVQVLLLSEGRYYGQVIE